MLSVVAPLWLSVSPALVATVQVTPPRFIQRKDKTEVVVTLTNTADHAVSILTGHAGDTNYFFALHLEDRRGKVVWDGAASRSVTTTDLPEGVFTTLAPHAQYRAVLDWRTLYNLAPGRYLLRAMYRVEPQDEPHAAGYYTSEIRKHHAFVGRVQSPAIGIESRAP